MLSLTAANFSKVFLRFGKYADLPSLRIGNLAITLVSPAVIARLWRVGNLSHGVPGYSTYFLFVFGLGWQIFKKILRKF